MERDDGAADDAVSEFVTLLAWDTPDDLHRLLVLVRPQRRTADTMLPQMLLQRSHAVDPSATVVTALLLLTDRRWRDAAGALAARVAAGGLLTDDEVALLAGAFVEAKPGGLFWRMPDAWFDGGPVIDLGPAIGPDSSLPGDIPADDVADGPAVTCRDVWLPLRRWAAAWLVRHGRDDWSRILARAGHLRGKAGAALVHGLLDALDGLPGDSQGVLVDQAETWPDHTVRKRASSLVAQSATLPASDRELPGEDRAATAGHGGPDGNTPGQGQLF